jgi:coenzyme F420-reducing hydrogenase delta subunit
MPDKKEVVIFACQQAVPSPEALKTRLEGHDLLVRIVPQPCSGKVEAYQLLRALAAPADLVWVFGCREDLCQYREGSHRLGGRLIYTQRYLEEIGLEAERLGRTVVIPGDEAGLLAGLKEIRTRLKTLGPSPLRRRNQPAAASKTAP